MLYEYDTENVGAISSSTSSRSISSKAFRFLVAAYLTLSSSSDLMASKWDARRCSLLSSASLAMALDASTSFLGFKMTLSFDSQMREYLQRRCLTLSR